MGEAMDHRRDPVKDRHLITKGEWYHYKRRVPTSVHAVVGGDTHVRKSLKTKDLAIAREKRNELEAADDKLWQALALGRNADSARKAYDAAVSVALALRLPYREAAQVADLPLPDVLTRLAAVPVNAPTRPIADAALGLVKVPDVSVSDAFDIYFDEIAPAELRGKSAQQRADWRKVKLRARNNFIAVVGEVPVSTITREQALKFYDFWRRRIAPNDAEIAEGALVTHSPASGNRDIGNMRVMFSAYHRHIGDMDRFNPFSGLGFDENDERTRPPFPTDWIVKTILAKGALDSLNAPARRIFLTLVETGARPSEICNLRPGQIQLKHEVPHLIIRPHRDRDDPREVKTSSAERKVPLVGVSLAAMRASPEGFPDYVEKGTTLSNTLMKHFRVHKLLPTPEHKIYSIRHSFEDRMKDAGIDEELRKLLMGHAIDRPTYGVGGSLKWRQENLQKIALPFDRAIV
ncbi:DUF6538 domain-containing protein [Devosia ginsengisoli]|uniref:DUF6538 domain-containing protein n=1 Tax=Devosia ginsengisoli TaxID=400770 RepID=UPI0026ED1930|nr:DUF6538 domain-containing protein [Devosia ginsengisoli]MCR6672160.1 integrase [Devosia ginsengisoli]